MKKKLKHYWKNAMYNLQTVIYKALTALSFLMLAFYFGYIVYYSTVCYSSSKVLVGCISLYIMIHLNKNI